jgi:hypothetical protein
VGKLRKALLGSFLVLITASSAAAQYTAQLSPAVTVFKGKSVAGGYFGIYDGALGFLGQYRYGIGGYTDIGGKIGLIDLESGSRGGDAGFVISLDSKYQVMEVRIMDPFDLSLGGEFELSVFEHINTFNLAGYAVGSYPVNLKSGRLLSPYARLILGVERADPEWGSSDSDFRLSFNMGATIELSVSTRAYAELQIDDDVAAFLMGLDFGL